jgi:putative FmdB family regulatory protein
MPVYEFRCQKCKKTFEKLCSINFKIEEIKCEYCSSEQVTRKMSSFATGGQRIKFDFNESNEASSSSCSSCSSDSCTTCGH